MITGKRGLRLAVVLALLAGFGVILPTRQGVVALQAQTQPVRIIFMHHSTGYGLISQGYVRELFSAMGYSFWDHGYNDEGLVDPAGNALGQNWGVPGDNTDPDGWHAVFMQPVTDPPANTFSHMLQYDVVIFKSCFPTSHISDEAMFEQYQRYFLAMRDVMDRHPDKLFIPFTTPPLVPNETDAESAARARRWAAYLTSDDYVAGHPNIAVFDFFTLLADEDSYLRADYRSDAWDSHPNAIANRAIGPQFVTFVDRAVRDFMPERAPSEVDVAALIREFSTEEPPEHSGPDESAVDSGSDSDRVAGILQLAIEVYGTWDYTNAPVTAFSSGRDSAGYDDDAALVLQFDIPPGGSAGTGFDLAPSAGWADAQGIALRVRADAPRVFRVALGVRDPDDPDSEDSTATPFDAEVRALEAEWSQLVIRWEDLKKAEWFGDMGVQVFDPAQVVWIAFDVGDWQSAQIGTLWIDDVSLYDE